MTRMLGILAATACLSLGVNPARGDDKDATPILDKAIAALGGEAKLAKAATFSWKGEGTIVFNQTEGAMKSRATLSGVDRQRSEFDIEFNGNPVKGLTILDGNKGWRKFGDDVQDLEGDALAASKQAVYLSAVPKSILPMKAKECNAEAAADQMVDGKPAAVVKGIGPDGRPFSVFFDKETGLPLKLTATVRSFDQDEVKEETTFADYKDVDGIKRATRIVSTRDGSPFLTMTLSDFRVVEAPDAATFAEPK